MLAESVQAAALNFLDAPLCGCTVPVPVRKYLPGCCQGPIVAAPEEALQPSTEMLNVISATATFCTAHQDGRIACH